MIRKPGVFFITRFLFFFGYPSAQSITATVAQFGQNVIYPIYFNISLSGPGASNCPGQSNKKITGPFILFDRFLFADKIYLRIFFHFSLTLLDFSIFLSSLLQFNYCPIFVLDLRRKCSVIFFLFYTTKLEMKIRLISHLFHLIYFNRFE